MCDRGDCGKTFRTNTELTIHKNLHDNFLEKCYFCPYSRALGKGGDMAIHITQHFNHPNFKCEICEKKFFRKMYLDKHFEVYHEKIEGKYKCPDCPYKTHSRECFTRHSRFYHKN